MPPSPFLLLSTIRSGTHFFCAVMNSHPQVKIHSEALFYDFDFSLEREQNFYTQWHRSIVEDPSQITQRNMRLFANDFIARHLQQGPEHGVVGMDIKYDFWDRLQFLRDYFLKESNPRPKVVHLVRKSTLRAHLSAFMLHCRNHDIDRGGCDIGEYNAYKRTGDRQARVTVTRQWLDVMEFLAQRKARFQAMATREFDSLELSYEDLAGPQRDDPGAFPPEQAQQLCKFLGIDPSLPMRTDMKKVNPQELREFIENYDELRAELKPLGLEWFLD